MNIFVAQVFGFLETQFAALGGLGVSLLIYAALRYMIERELNPSDDSTRQ